MPAAPGPWLTGRTLPVPPATCGLIVPTPVVRSRSSGVSQAAQQAAVAAELERWSARLRAHAPEVAAWGRTAGRSLDDAGLAGPASDALAALVARVAASVGAVGDSMEQTADLMQVRAATARTYAATWPGGR